MPAPSPPSAPHLPFPIFRVSQKVERYLLYEINIITWLRQAHNILGVLIGTLPQIPQQNVFLGLPLELQPEEARLLFEKGVAYAVDDREWHLKNLASKTNEDVEAFRANMEKERREVAREFERSKQKRTQNVLDRMNDNYDTAADKTSTRDRVSKEDDDPPEESLFAESTARTRTISISDSELNAWAITPTTSYPPLSEPSKTTPKELPKAEPSSYALFKHLHSRGYFMSPGIRFGCQFSVYPGDPLRFHSHFLSISYEWDEEINLLDLIGGGRLGTGVKKGWLIGGVEEQGKAEARMTAIESAGKDDSKEPKVRTFCIEWGGM